MNKRNFNEEYNKIKQLVSTDFERLDRSFESYFSTKIQEDKKNQILPIINEFFSVKGKRIRSLMIFLLTRAMNKELSDFHYKLALSVEMIHNATLIHDDIVDCSLLRRGRKTINFDYDSKLAVLAGDYLLAEVIKMLSVIENKNIRNLYSEAMSEMINGELNQYFNRFKICTIEEYIEKSKAKTAKLFEAGIVSVMYFENESVEVIKNITDFALNFGIAFQIQNDLGNMENFEKVDEDINNGDYSAPLIFFIKEKYGDDVTSIHNVKKAAKQLKNTDAMEKTRTLATHYANLAIENISFLEDNLYKQALNDLCNLFKD